jgi:hypothetical protein
MTNQLTMLGGDVGASKPANIGSDPVILGGALTVNGPTTIASQLTVQSNEFVSGFLATTGPTQASYVTFPGNTPNIYGGTGAPAAGLGLANDFYFRSDGGALTTIYQKRAGTWTGIV